MFMLRVISVLKSVFFPKTCAGCGVIIGEDDELCDYCHEMLVRCDPLKRCMRCKAGYVLLQIPPQNDLRYHACKANGALR